MLLADNTLESMERPKSMSIKSVNFLLAKSIAYLCGFAMSVNFAFLWAAPIFLMGTIWKNGLKNVLMPIYQSLDSNKTLRKIAKEFVYSQPEHSDFFVTSILLMISSISSISWIFYCQFKNGRLSWLQIFLYYCCWVGVGGRMMGAAYALSHKEGHNRGLYKKWIRDSVGNINENWFGLFYGSVPWSFTTSHIFIHHRLDGGIGDTFYLWDLDRTSFSDFLLYVHRILLHMTGYSSIKILRANNQSSKATLLEQGVWKFWIAGAIVLTVTQSISFFWFIFIQPLLCMTYFLALINVGFHGFIEFDDKNVSIQCVNSTAIIEGDDDCFGEDDHMAHHYFPGVYFSDLPAHQASQVSEFKKHHASVFRKLSIVELSIFIMFSLWSELAKHYVDYSGKLSKEDVMSMLKRRAVKTEITYQQYVEYLANPTPEARQLLLH